MPPAPGAGVVGVIVVGVIVAGVVVAGVPVGFGVVVVGPPVVGAPGVWGVDGAPGVVTAGVTLVFGLTGGLGLGEVASPQPTAKAKQTVRAANERCVVSRFTATSSEIQPLCAEVLVL
jgi:hypothetical protein